ncbi:MAG: tetratricopeptide repeat protein [Saprospiraceae bacterium]
MKALELEINNKKDSAIIVFNQAIALDPTFDLPHRNKFRIYFTRNDFHQALIECEALIKINPDETQWWFNSGMILDKLGDDQKAKAHYLKTLELIEIKLHKRSEKDYRGQHQLAKGLILILLEKEQEGRNEIEKLIETNPGNERIISLSKINKKEYLENVLDKQLYFNEDKF